ncbi:hypothetical protein [Streptomyces sp. NPDC058371]|uniref:hypothetical protein n=1 Tax=Streptomyces sp. NPDC058371 TaxID=3346463 RepID=UPI0036470562
MIGYGERKAHVTLLACAALICVSGCGGKEGDSSFPPSSSAPAPGSSAERSAEASPLEKYLMLPIGDYSFTAQQMYVISKAEGKLTDSCMRKYGLTYGAKGFDSPAKYIPGTNRRYGVLNPDVVSKYGYHFPEQAPAVSVPELSEKEILTLNGQPGGSAEVKGVRVPQGGCLGQAKGALRGEYSYEKGAGVARSIASNSFEDSLTSPNVVAATSAWAKCMKRGGFSYSTPMQALGAPENSGNRITKREISVAKTDVACKLKTDLVKVWSNQEADIQRSMIKNHRKELDLLSKAHRKVLAEARSIIH